MTDGCNRRNVVDTSILAAKAFVQEPAESTLAKVVVKSVKVIPAHLIHDHPYYDVWAVCSLLLSGFALCCSIIRKCTQQDQGCGTNQSLHISKRYVLCGGLFSLCVAQALPIGYALESLYGGVLAQLLAL